MNTSDYYLSCADTAKLVRAALKTAFPGQKFSVRSHTYSGGASIDVTWTDGPIIPKVENVIKPYEGASFDGMIDLKTSKYHWLMADGTVKLFQADVGHSYGSTAYGLDGRVIAKSALNSYVAGMRTGAGVPTTRHADEESFAYQDGVRNAQALKAQGGRLVHFGADFIFTHREFSPGYEQSLHDAVLALSRDPGPFDGNKRYSFGIEVPGRAYEDYGNTLVWQISRLDPDTLAQAVERETLAAQGQQVGYYVTVIRNPGANQKVGVLLGPYSTKGEADAQVPAGRDLAHKVDPFTGFDAFGVTKVTMKPGESLPEGKLNALLDKELAA